MLDISAGHGDMVSGDAVISYTLYVMLLTTISHGDMIVVAAVISYTQ